MLGGLALALNSIACYSILSSDYKDNFQEVVGMLETFAGLGIIIGPLITTLFYVLFGAFWAFTITALLTLATAIPAYIWLGPERPYVKLPKPVIEAPNIIYDSVRQTQTILADLMALITGMFGVGYLDLELTSYLVSLGCTPTLASCIYILICINYAVFSLVSSRIPPSVDLRVVITGGFVALSAAFAFCGTLPPLPQSLWIIAVGAALQGFGLSTVTGSRYSVSVFPHMLSHSTEVLGVPQDDLLSDKIASKLYTGYGGAANALGFGSGPIICGLLVNAVGMQRSFWVLFGVFAVLACLYAFMTGLWRRLLGLKETRSKTKELGYHLVPNPPFS
jgi:MFS family permease